MLIFVLLFSAELILFFCYAALYTIWLFVIFTKGWNISVSCFPYSEQINTNQEFSESFVHHILCNFIMVVSILIKKQKSFFMVQMARGHFCKAHKPLSPFYIEKSE